MPGAWSKLDEAHVLVVQLVSLLQQYADIDRMTPDRLDELLSGLGFSNSDKTEILTAHEKAKCYREILFWNRLRKVRRSFGELKSYVARNGVLLSPDLEEKFRKISDMLWSVVVSKEVGHEAQDFAMQRRG